MGTQKHRFKSTPSGGGFVSSARWPSSGAIFRRNVQIVLRRRSYFQLWLEVGQRFETEGNNGKENYRDGNDGDHPGPQGTFGIFEKQP